MIIRVILQPAAKQEKLVIQQDLEGHDIYRIWIREKPIDGEANAALVTFLSHYFGLAKRDVTIVKGHTGRQKLVDVKISS